MSSSTTEPTGRFGILDAATGREVPVTLQRLILTGTLLPAGARLSVRHDFVTASQGSVEIVYAFMLPRDGALRSFTVTGPSFSARSRLVPATEAVELYEEGLEEGHLSVQAQALDDGLVNLAVGNVRSGEPVTVELELLAGVELRDDGFRFRFPFTIAPSYHRRARVAAVPGGGVVELPGDPFQDVLLPPFRIDAKGLHEIACFLDVQAPLEGMAVASPSHPVRVGASGGRLRVGLVPGSALPDRDLILDVTVETPSPFVLAGPGGDGRTHFAAVVPSLAFGEPPEGPGNVVFLLDRSGSMDGPPIEQAHRALTACIAALAETDRFGVVAFDTEVERFATSLVPASRDNRRAAADWLDRIGARGGTELAAALEAASELFEGEEGDVLVLTDGQVFDTRDVLHTARLAGVRFHALGIGAASQDRFLALLARETDGVSRFVTPGERVDEAALDLFASISRPVATGIRMELRGFESAETGPEPSRSVFAGTPMVAWGECDPGRNGTILLTWKGADGSPVELPVSPGDPTTGETIRLLRGARLITDLDTHRPDGHVEDTASRRTARRIDSRLRSLSERFGLASREMALVAVVEREGDRPGDVPRTELVPVGLPAWMNPVGVFGDSQPVAPVSVKACIETLQDRSLSPENSDDLPVRTPAAIPSVPTPDLVELLGLLEPDGGLPVPEFPEPPEGMDTGAYRTLATILLLLACVEAGSSERRGPYRTHVVRMLAFLQRDPEGTVWRSRIDALIRAVRFGIPVDCPGEGLHNRWLPQLGTLLDDPWNPLLLAHHIDLLDRALAAAGL